MIFFDHLSRFFSFPLVYQLFFFFTKTVFFFSF